MSRIWLTGGAIFVAALLIVSIVVALTQGEESFSEGTPERAVQLYLKAVQDEDYEAAYSLLSEELSEGCTVEQFATNAARSGDSLRNNWVSLKETKRLDGSAIVIARVSHISGNGLFGADEYSYDQPYTLKNEDGDWRLTENPWPYYGCPPPSPIPPVQYAPRPGD